MLLRPELACCLLMFFLAGTDVGADERVVQMPTSESLKSTYIAWQKDMFSNDVDVRVAALERMWPKSKDMAVLFPDHADKLTQLLDASKNRMIKRLRTAPDEVLVRQRERLSKLGTVKTIDVRTDDNSELHRNVLKLISKDLPVYRLLADYGGNTAGSSSYVFVNNRWVHFRDLTSVPDVLPRLDELLEKLPSRKP